MKCIDKGFETNSIDLHLIIMEGQKITEAVRTLFKAADGRDWQTLLSVIADEVYLDYSSMNNVEPSAHSHEQVLEAWGSFLSSFERSNHNLTEFKVQLHGDEADVAYAGKADYFIGGEIWTVYGSYNTTLQKQDGKWLIVSHKLNYDRQSGNSAVMRLANEILSKRKAEL
jgi:ketosteroid isomerase-like protein